MTFNQCNVPNQNMPRLKGRGEDQKPIHVSRYDLRERKDVRRKYRTAKSIKQTKTGWEVTP